MRLMPLKRYCGHYEEIRAPESGERFLMERGRYCKHCLKAFRQARKIRLRKDNRLPPAMESAMALWRES